MQHFFVYRVFRIKQHYSHPSMFCSSNDTHVQGQRLCAYETQTKPLPPAQSSGAVWKSKWPSWAPVPNKLTVSVDVKQHFSNNNLPPSLTLTKNWGNMTFVLASNDTSDSDVNSVATTSPEPLSDAGYVSIGVYVSLVGTSLFLVHMKQFRQRALRMTRRILPPPNSWVSSWILTSHQSHRASSGRIPHSKFFYTGWKHKSLNHVFV